MNAKQLMNMVMRIVMRKTISKGIDAGVKQATRSTRTRAPAPSRAEMDDTGKVNGANVQSANNSASPPKNGLTKAEVRQQRQARRAARQARQEARSESGPNGS